MFVFATFAGAPVLPKTLAQVVTLAVQDNIAAQIWGSSCVAQSLPDSILDVGLACTFHWHWPDTLWPWLEQAVDIRTCCCELMEGIVQCPSLANQRNDLGPNSFVCLQKL